jgi:hypothetical protein
MAEIFAKDRLRLLLDHFGAVGDPREAAKVKYPLREVLFLVTCATIAGCDDYDEITAWGDVHIGFLRGYSEYYFGTPKEDWLRVVLNRIDPALFEACFTVWALSLRSDAADLIALDVIFKEDQSRLRRGHGAHNMALVRRLAFNFVRAGRGKKSIKTARKAAGWDPKFLAALILPQPR